MTETKQALCSELERGDWVYHTDLATKKKLVWRVFRVETHPNILVLSREQLDVKKSKIKQGTYLRGNASCTNIIAPVEPDRTFELAPHQYLNSLNGFGQRWHYDKKFQNARFPCYILSYNSGCLSCFGG